MTEFVMQGFEALDTHGELGKKFNKEVQRKIKLATRRGLTKSLENVVYGRSERINERNVSSDSVVAGTARKLKIKPHHIYFRTFIRAVKVSSAKPFAASMISTNGINVVSLLVDNAKDAKKATGFQTRKKKIGKKEKPGNMSSLIDKARIGGKNSGTVRINNKTYQDTYLVDGSLRASSDYWDNHYVNHLGAKRIGDTGRIRKLGGKGNYIAIQKKNQSQPKPYPTRAVKISKEQVNKAVESTVKSSLRTKMKKQVEIQQKEIVKTLGKMGFDIS